jgi:hypothetical protein
MFIYIIKSEVNEYGERHVDKVVRDVAIHHKSGIYVTEKNGFVKDRDVMLAYTAEKLKELVLSNAWNGYFSKDLCHQYKAQTLVEQTLMRNAKARQVA